MGHHVSEYELNQMKLEKEIAEQEHLNEVRSVYNEYAQEKEDEEKAYGYDATNLNKFSSGDRV